MISLITVLFPWNVLSKPFKPIKEKNVLTIARDAIDKIIVEPRNESLIRSYSNILDNDDEPFWIAAGYLTSLIVTSIKIKHLEIEGNSLSGTEGFWDVSKTVKLHMKYAAF